MTAALALPMRWGKLKEEHPSGGRPRCTNGVWKLAVGAAMITSVMAALVTAMPAIVPMW